MGPQIQGESEWLTCVLQCGFRAGRFFRKGGFQKTAQGGAGEVRGEVALNYDKCVCSRKNRGSGSLVPGKAVRRLWGKRGGSEIRGLSQRLSKIARGLAAGGGGRFPFSAEVRGGEGGKVLGNEERKNNRGI